VRDVRRWGVQRAVNSLGRGRCVLRLGHRPRSRRQHSAARVVPLDRLVYVALCSLGRIPHRPRGRVASTPDVRRRRLSNPEVRVVRPFPFQAGAAAAVAYGLRQLAVSSSWPSRGSSDPINTVTDRPHEGASPITAISLRSFLLPADRSSKATRAGRLREALC
jgi:hypothetical protein